MGEALGRLASAAATRVVLWVMRDNARARGFYERHGYTAAGDVYDEVGIPHVAMEKRV